MKVIWFIPGHYYNAVYNVKNSLIQIRHTPGPHIPRNSTIKSKLQAIRKPSFANEYECYKYINLLGAVYGWVK